MTGRVVVTGGSGFVGSHLVERLAEQGREVVVYDAAAPPKDQVREPDLVRYVTGDIRDADRLAEVITPEVEVVYHLAAVVGVDTYLGRPLDVIDVAFGGTKAVLGQACRTGAKVVMVSTSEIYGKNEVVPWKEDADRVLGSTATDRWSYSSSKALAEHLTFAYMRQHGLRATILRYFNVYGPRQRPAYLVSRTVHRALRGLPPVVYDDGRQTRCFTYVADAVEGTILAGESPKADGECFNLGSTYEMPIGRVIEMVGELAGGLAQTVTVETDQVLGNRYQDMRRRVPDASKALATLGWRASTPLAKGLAAVIRWGRRNPWWLELPENGLQ
uniref:Putative UDP-glucose 4-epimerase n=1 Tax=Actinomadura melliaura TaxID=360723 RepID=Q0H2W2_9ACTN|nr:putative UDP-glucose 4-epimerase [Actinomadura melliaura]